MSYATSNDVARELRGSTSLSSEEGVQWQAWIDRVEREIERRFRRVGLDLADQVALGDPLLVDVIDVEVAAAIRKIDNPRGLTSSTRSIDDASITDRWDHQDAADPLALTDAEWAMLLPQVSSGAFSTRPGFEPDLGPRFF